MQRQISKRFIGLFGLMLVLTLALSYLSSFGYFGNGGRMAIAQSPGSVVQFNKDAVVLGTNLFGVYDWSTQLPFLDAFKSSRPWMTQCQAGETGCTGKWTTNEEKLLNLDADGWVKTLPRPEEAPEYTRVGTLLLRDLNGKYPGGKYVVLYEGEGTIDYGFDAKKDATASRPGRDVIDVTPSSGGIYLSITRTDPNRRGRYIRNIRVVQQQYERTFQRDVFNPDFLKSLQNYKAVRFMDWMRSNDTDVTNWSDRARVTNATYATSKGVPPEIMIDLANRLGVVPWFNMPYKSTDDYIRNFAQLVRQRLDSRLKVYVEFSNEVWNWQFPQANYALEQGKRRWGQDKGDAYMQWYGMRTAQMSNIWKQVYGRERDRVVSIISTQTGWKGLETSALDCPLWVAEGNRPCFQNNIDVYAITGYFSANMTNNQNVPAIESWLRDEDGGFGKAFTQINQGSILPKIDGFDDSLPGVLDLFRYHKKVATDRRLSLIAYEGGQHLVKSDNDRLTNFYMQINRRPEMFNTYRTLLSQWEQAGGALFMHFSDVGTPSKWGSWGALEFLNQGRSPKYDALMEFARSH